MISALNLIIAAGLLAILYGYVVGKQILIASPGNVKMQEIASAIQIGAKAYLNRQYKTIAIVGFIIFVIITGCSSYPVNNEDVKIINKESFVSKGFALVYSDNLYKEKIV